MSFGRVVMVSGFCKWRWSIFWISSLLFAISLFSPASDFRSFAGLLLARPGRLPVYILPVLGMLELRDQRGGLDPLVFFGMVFFLAGPILMLARARPPVLSKLAVAAS